jgi:ubiquinone biosynthesis protein
MALMEGIGRILDPDFNLIEMTKPYLKKILLKRYDPRRLGLEMARRVEDALDLVNTAPDSLKDILQKIRKGELGINFHHQGLDHLIRELDKSTNRLSFSLIIASLIIASSLVMQIDKGPQLFGMPAFGFLGYIIAGMLGLWLVVAILRSGKM